MFNLLVIGKYSSFSIIKSVIKVIEDNTIINSRIIVKKGDAVPASPLIAMHEKNMKGDLCDMLWEVVTMDQDAPLVIASTRGFLYYPEIMKKLVSPASLSLICSESTFASFKLDNERRLYESSALTASTPYLVRFNRTSDFTDVAKALILQRKCEEDGNFELHTLINQFILLGTDIEVEIADFRKSVL